MSNPSDAFSEHEQRLHRILADYLEARRTGAAPDREELLQRHPDLAEELRGFFADEDQFDRAGEPVRAVLEQIGAARTDTLASGQTLAPGESQRFGEYELLEEIGRGGMGIVYRARHIRLGRVVALKRIRTGELASAEEVARFRREAEAAATLDHPHIVPIYEVRECEGQQYFTMKLIEGGHLGQGGDGRGASTRGEQRRAAELMMKVARAVHHAHQRGILHRDLKPGNILIDADGQPHVSDYGLAQPIEKEARLTQSGAIVGTPEYMAPEQARGEKGLTTAADVYALGATLYYLLAGQPPFRGNYNWETLRQVVEQEPARPRSHNRAINRDLERICLKCLEKNPGKRYQSAEDFASDLERWLKGLPPKHVRVVSETEKLLKWARRHPTAAALIVVTALAALTVLGMGLAYNRELARQIAIVGQQEAALASTQQELGVQRDSLERAENDVIQKDKELGEEKKKVEEAKDENRKNELRIIRLTEDLEVQAEVSTRRLFQSQLMRVADAVEKKDYYLANVLLYDESKCPVALRSTAWNYYANLCRGRIQRLTRLDRFDSAFAFISGESTLVSISPRGFELWDTQSGKLRLRHEIDLGKYELSKARFSPDGKAVILSAASEGDTVWDVTTGQLVRGPAPLKLDEATQTPPNAMGGDGLFKPPPSPEGRYHRPLAFSPDRRKILTTSTDGDLPGPDLAVWDIQAGEMEARIGPVLEQLPGSTSSPPGIRKAVSSPDGKTVALSMSDDTLLLCDLQPKAAYNTLTVKKERPAFGASPHPAILAVESENGDVELIDLPTLQTRKTIAAVRVQLKVRTAAYSAQGKTLVLGVWSQWRSSGFIEIRKGDDYRLIHKLPWDHASLFLSHDGKTLAALKSTDGGQRITFRDTHSGKETGTWALEKGMGVRFLDLSPDGQSLALAGMASSRDGKAVPEVQVLDVGTRKKVLSLPVDRPCNWARFSPDGKTLVSWGDGEENLTVWDLESGKKRTCLPGRFGCFSPDGKHVATWNDRGEIKLWHGSNGELKATYQVTWHSGWFHHLTFSPDGKYLTSLHAHPGDPHRLSEVVVWDIQHDEETASFPVVGEVGTSPCFTDGNGRLLCVLHESLQVWDVTNQQLKHFHSYALWEGFEQLEFTPDDRALITRPHPGSNWATSIWDIKTGECKLAFSKHVGSSQDGRYVTLSSRVGLPEAEVLIWDVTSGRWHGRCKVPRLRHALLSPDGSTLATVSSNASDTGDELRLWDVTTGKMRAHLVPPWPPWGTPNSTGIGGLNPGRVQDDLLSFSKDGKFLAAVFDEPEGNLRGGRFHGTLWKVPSGHFLKSHRHPLHVGVQFSPDGQKVVMGTELYDLGTLQLLRRGFADCQFSPDRRTAIVANPGEKGSPCAVRDVKTGKILGPCEAPGGSVPAFHDVFSPDGGTIAFAYQDGIHLLDARTGGTQAVLRSAHGGALGVPGFSADGKYLIALSYDAGKETAIVVWNCQPPIAPGQAEEKQK